MSSILIEPSRLSGRVKVPLSKSAAHRAAICAALAGNLSVLPENEPLSDDVAATKRAAAQIINASESGTGGITVDCGESGSTLRFLIPVAAALGVKAVFTGHGRLPSRPLGVYLDCLPRRGVNCESEGGLPLKVSGRLTPGVFTLPGDVSSQFITGLLLSLPLLESQSEIRLSSPLESAGYVGMTVQTMEAFGVHVEKTQRGWLIPGRQSYKTQEAYAVERDWSQAAFFIEAGALGGDVEIEGLNFSSKQGDMAAENLFKKFGAAVTRKHGMLSVSRGSLRGMEIDASQIPDLVPALAAAAALCKGRTVIYNAKRLRLKESDRLSAMAGGLNSLGGRVREAPDGLVIDGVKKLTAGKADGCRDHRVVMALAVAASRADGGVTISDSESVSKSYPAFFDDYRRLGGKAYDLGR